MWVNDELRQDGNTSDMVVDIAGLVESVSAVFPLRPGDILITGTPAGVGAKMDPPRFLQPATHPDGHHRPRRDGQPDRGAVTDGRPVVGFVGLGAMGARMAARLVQSATGSSCTTARPVRRKRCDASAPSSRSPRPTSPAPQTSCAAALLDGSAVEHVYAGEDGLLGARRWRAARRECAVFDEIGAPGWPQQPVLAGVDVLDGRTVEQAAAHDVCGAGEVGRGGPRRWRPRRRIASAGPGERLYTTSR